MLLAGLFDFIKTIFVPDIDDLKLDEFKDLLFSKFTFLQSFESIITEFNTYFNSDGYCPDFSFQLPQFLGGATVSPINFTFYNQYRSVVHGFIIACSYFLFIRKTFKSIPGIIKGGK